MLFPRVVLLHFATHPRICMYTPQYTGSIYIRAHHHLTTSGESIQVNICKWQRDETLAEGERVLTASKVHLFFPANTHSNFAKSPYIYLLARRVCVTETLYSRTHTHTHTNANCICRTKVERAREKRA